MYKSENVKSFLVLALLGALSSACTTFSTATQSEVTENFVAFSADVFEMAESAGRDNLLVVFDIDNTLLAMEQGLGSDQWYEWQKEMAANDSCDEMEVSSRLAVQGAVFSASAMRPTQADAPGIVRRFQDAGISVIALTSRGVDYRLQTFRELRRNGYDFRRNAIGPGAGWPENFIPDNGTRPARYEDGVFLTTGQHKGAMLQELLRRTDTPIPGVIIMADDKQRNLDAVLETFTELGVPVHAWRYSGEDRNVAAFDEDLSDQMWRELLPAMETIQRVLGPDNFELPENNSPENCL